MSNVDTIAQGYKDRLIRVMEEQRAAAEMIKDIGTEMRGSGMDKTRIAAVKLAARRHFETSEKKALRETVEELAAALGEFADSPLGAAALGRHAS